MEISQLYKLFLASSGVSTDTRQIGKGVLFFALKGVHFNGNQFAEKALEAGAAYAIIDEENPTKNERLILVKDSLTTLQQLANYHRRQLTIPVLAITGSNGKTTTKELTCQVLSQKYKTYATKGNLNNHIGIPLTLLAIKKGAEIAIVEMGANHQKEIESYCKIAEPTHGIINNIGKAHLEGFGGFEGVKKGKGELYDYLLKNEGIAFINSQNPILMEMQKFPNPILYPQAGDFYHCSLIDTHPFLKLRTEKAEEISTHLIGAYNFDNIAAALCIGKFFNVPSKDANRAIANYIPENNRSQVVQKGTSTIILDAYNANPSSMKAAIENFALLPQTPKIAILGDMFELGNEAEEEHFQLGKLLKSKNLDKAFLCGKAMEQAYKAFPEAIYCETREVLIEKLSREKIRGAQILIKGSRGMGLEKIIDNL